MSSIDKDLIVDTLYNKNENTRPISCETNQINLSEELNVAEWSQSTFNQVWSEAVAKEISSIAAFDPRPLGEPQVLQERKLFNKKENKWEDIIQPQISPTVLPAPSELPAMWAVRHPEGAQGVDFRPHLWDDEAKSFCLVDSGSQVTAWPADPGDQVVPSMRLKAVNGSKIDCFGHKDIAIKIGRKEYKFRAIKANIQTPVLG